MNKHLRDILTGQITKTNIIGLRKAFNAYARTARGYCNSRFHAAITEDEFRELNTAIFRKQPRVIGELHDTGVTLLQDKRYHSRWTNAQLAAIDAIDHFELVRFEQYVGTSHVPVYRVRAHDGHSFIFRNIPWQAAGNGPEVLSE